MHYSKILVRATNWVGDAVMSLPALRAIRDRFPAAEIAVLAKPWVADLYARESWCDRTILYPAEKGWRARLQVAAELRRERFDCAILLQNAFEAALIAWLARVPVRIGYDRDARGFLLTNAVRVPKPGEIPAHQRFYYLELLRRAGVIDVVPDSPSIRLERPEVAATATVGVSPGAAYGSAKRWLPERFAEAAVRLARESGGGVAIFGSGAERLLCEEVAGAVRAAGVEVRNYAGETSLGQFIELAAACRVFLTNDSGAMHIASALGVPTITVFGATDHVATGPTGELARVVREAVECSPCLLRECPIDHRCMTAVTAERVVSEALSVISLVGIGGVRASSAGPDTVRGAPAPKV